MASVSGWTEGILLSLLFVIVFTSIIGGMNSMYGENYQTNLTTQETLNAFSSYTDTSTSEIKGGEADFSTGSGLTLTSSWGIIKGIANTVWGFLGGSWIGTIFGYLKIPAQIALIFRLLYIISVILIVLKILFKVKA